MGQIFWQYLGGAKGESIDELFFNINGLGSASMNAMDYLLAVAIEAVFPKITLVNTPDKVPFYIAFLNQEIVDPDASVVIDAGEQLYFYLSDGASGLPAGQVFIGTRAALTNARNAGGLGVAEANILPFESHSPRHRVGWGQHALLAAIESVAFQN